MIRGGKAADSQEQPVKGLYRYALATALATFLLLILGGGVTSSDVGMADPQWPTPPWYLIWYFSAFVGWQEDPYSKGDQSLEMVLEKRVARLKYSRATGPRLSSCRATFLSQVRTPCFSAQ